ncbi:hypothetical protein OK349_04540 [Sphingomonas sp. BT-65]|uniref:hypothetical protein n=1 Tax=Sphingomonas sp. BT-65 TaxID=2989821 RepID=UPI0022367435|nr:hypothetical protein [Sphingomonas sp. BT-65]MCW4460964.1 hypothetical protein [Sphingomonas sp. BT-65]
MFNETSWYDLFPAGQAIRRVTCVFDGQGGPGTVPDFISTETLLAHPRFDSAASLLIDGLARLHGDARRLVRDLFEYDRAVTFMLAICIAMNERDEDPATWLSVATLAGGAAQMGIGPARRVRRMVEEMRSDGHLLHEAMPGDRRRHRLRPSELMLAIDREWVAVFHAPLALLMPEEPRYRPALARDPEYHRVYRKMSLQTLEVARRTISEHPAVDSFLHQAAGARVLTTLMQAMRDNPDGWSPPGFYSTAAERSATTRVHVRNMLRAAALLGYVEITEAPDVRVRATRLLRDDFARWVAASLSSTDLVAAISRSR